jgi:hypothetical protein
MPPKITRAHQIAVSRWRMGYTRLTHSYILEKKDKPICEDCDTDLTVPHILFSCSKHTDTRTSIGLSPEDLNGEEDGTEKLYAFLSETGLIMTT